ncbi:hypothetical protein OJAV_G00043050 [Oryzias javanicus]|uniref:Uncharacterized protein n=1 Tax=Oryzias javanicus TaxID=123683 RepID=A0A3S2PXN4_ORYJA|nr:hypothetical protein OJAV_G00043050 [Oryzias javanicus]
MLNERTEEVEAVRKKGGGEADCGWSDSENARLCPPSILPLLLRLEIHPSGSAADICVEDLGRTGRVLSLTSDCSPHLRGRRTSTCARRSPPRARSPNFGVAETARRLRGETGDLTPTNTAYICPLPHKREAGKESSRGASRLQRQGEEGAAGKEGFWLRDRTGSGPIAEALSMMGLLRL